MSEGVCETDCCEFQCTSIIKNCYSFINKLSLFIIRIHRRQNAVCLLDTSTKERILAFTNLHAIAYFKSLSLVKILILKNNGGMGSDNPPISAIIVQNLQAQIY